MVFVSQRPFDLRGQARLSGRTFAVYHITMVSRGESASLFLDTQAIIIYKDHGGYCFQFPHPRVQNVPYIFIETCLWLVSES